MKPLSKDQVETIVEWLKEWKNLESSVIPVRFREDFLKEDKSHWTISPSPDVCSEHFLSGYIHLGGSDPLRSLELPPVGLKSKAIHDEQRQIEILEAMQRFSEVDKPIPKEWIDELMSYRDTHFNKA